MKTEKLSVLVLLALLTAGVLLLIAYGRKEQPIMSAESENAAKSLYEITVKEIDGNTAKLHKYRGKVMLIVNVASRCGYTSQYEGLQKVFAKYQDQGLVVLGFPANDFGAQEPGTNEEIRQFCTVKYKVTFPMFAKITVKGADKHPLYQYLTDKSTNPQFSGEISWNFNKFLVDRSGKTVARFESSTAPESETLTSAIEAALKQ